jgi:hypothetical protein
MTGIVRRIEREIGVPGLSRILADELSASDLQSLLMEVFRRRAQLRRPDELIGAIGEDRFVRPSGIAPLALNSWEQLALAHCADHFEAVELSPLTPLGTNLVTAGVSQDWAVATVRRNEVVSDPTNVLALEAARRRKRLQQADARAAEPVHLAASHRVVRPQRYRDRAMPSHFRLFALVSTGRDTGHYQLEAAAVSMQLDLILGLLNDYFARLVPLQVAYTLPGATPGRHDPRLLALADAAAEYGAALVEEPQRAAAEGYYAGFCFHVHAYSTEGRWVEVADGGEVDWGQRLVNGKERMVISGIGSERVVALHQEMEV